LPNVRPGIAGQIEAADQERIAAEKLRTEYQQQMHNAKNERAGYCG